jgi:membrane-bound metal-dependent hydrolase YbcI (DUF457 family)
VPLPLAHSLVGAGLVAALHPRPFERKSLPLFVGAALANCPDLDFAISIATHRRGWHRGFTHSIAFAFAFALCLLAALGWRRRRTAIAYGSAFASHGLLDFATTKVGGGVELLWPFTRERYGLRVWSLSELPSLAPSLGVMRYLLIEGAIFLPLFLIIYMLRRRALKEARGPSFTQS